MRTFPLFLISLLISCPAFATEADYFTRRKDFPDTLPSLNQRMNGILKKISQESTSCDEGALHFSLMKHLGGFVVANIEKWAEHLPGNYAPAIGESIYEGLSLEAKFLYWGCCAPVFRAGSSVISGDKLGHFLHSGYEMFYVARSITDNPIPDSRSLPVKALDLWQSPISGSIVEQAREKFGIKDRRVGPEEYEKIADSFVLEVSHGQENQGWGLQLTGVKSYGDIAANFEGFRFWSDLTGGKRPYYTCRKHKWIQTREFDWNDYVTDAWDEGVNCSEFSTKKFTSTVAKRVSHFARKSGWASDACPVEPGSCGHLIKRYGRLASQILSPGCYSAGKRLAEAELEAEAAKKRKPASSKKKRP